MADVRISELPEATSVSNEAILLVSDQGVSKKIPLSSALVAGADGADGWKSATGGK